MFDTDYAQKNNITADNILSKVEDLNTANIVFNIKQVYMQDDYTYPIYYVYYTLIDLEHTKFTDCYLTIYVDIVNQTFAIIPINNEDYESIVASGKQVAAKAIEQNSYNTYLIASIEDDTTAMMHFDNYKYTVEEDYKQAYNLLDETYRNKEFGSVEAYKNYLDQNDITKVVMSSCDVEFDGDSVQYICTDKNGNKYIFTETEPMQYKLTLSPAE